MFPIVDARVLSEVCPLFFSLGTGEGLKIELAKAGFGDATVERLSSTHHYVTPAEACAAAFEGGPVALDWSKFSAEVRAGAQAEYLTSLGPYLSGPGYAELGRFVVGRGVKPER